MNPYTASDEDVSRFNRDGYLIVRALFDAEEMRLLAGIARGDRSVLTDPLKREGATSAPGAKLYQRQDTTGHTTKLWLSNTIQDDVFGAVVRCRRVVDTLERLLDGEVYHYHHKMTLKEPRVGGAWEWHQDYGYWYENGCLLPDMASCMLAVDRATRANGCLQVIEGSQRLGRINHALSGTQTGADMERVQVALQRMKLVYVELDPGDTLFFHANTLHRSDANTSPDPRWSLICCYNTARNDPYKATPHPSYSPLEKWPDERVKEVGRRQWAQLQELASAR